MRRKESGNEDTDIRSDGVPAVAVDVLNKWGEEMKCWDCECFKIIQEPLRSGKDIYDFGRAECTNFDLVVDFINHGV